MGELRVNVQKMCKGNSHHRKWRKTRGGSKIFPKSETVKEGRTEAREVGESVLDC